MLLSDVIMIAGDTSRSRCYLQAMCAKKIYPKTVIILPSQQTKPGQINARTAEIESVRCSWGEFDPSVPIEKTAALHALDYVHAPTGDINSVEICDFLSRLTAQVCIYSGFGGILLKKDILACGKQFLHIHGGWLPDYKGSTTNHYSALEAGFCAASSIFLTKDIDAGKILIRKKFPVPDDPQLLDHVYDGLFRTEVLLETLECYVRDGRWPDSGVKNKPTRHYYIMHPVLRHVLILRQRGASKKQGASK